MAGRYRVQTVEGRPLLDGPAILALALLAAVLVGAVAARRPLVAMAPGLASLYGRLGLDVNRVGLALDDVRTLRDVADGAPGLVVEGTIRNLGSAVAEVPPLRLVLVDGAGVRVGGWQQEPGQPRLQPRETQKFRARLATPPDQARKVSVSFALGGTEG